MAFQASRCTRIDSDCRDTLDERVKGLQSGADDYLCKPFALAEVAARLQALFVVVMVIIIL